MIEQMRESYEQMASAATSRVMRTAQQAVGRFLLKTLMYAVGVEAEAPSKTEYERVMGSLSGSRSASGAAQAERLKVQAAYLLATEGEERDVSAFSSTAEATLEDVGLRSEVVNALHRRDITTISQVFTEDYDPLTERQTSLLMEDLADYMSEKSQQDETEEGEQPDEAE